MGIFDERTPLKLDPEKLGLTDPDQLRMARAIAAATEATRVALRADDFFGARVDHPARGFYPSKLREPVFLVDRMPWPSLLAMDNCADDAAKLAGGKDKQLLIAFAMRLCAPDQFAMLALLRKRLAEKAVYERLPQDIAKQLSPVIKPLKDKADAIKKGGCTGGKKGSETRRKKAKIPPADVLTAQAKKLIAEGREPHEVSGILGLTHGVKADTIRRKLGGSQALKSMGIDKA